MGKRLNRSEIYRLMAAYDGSLPAEVDYMIDDLKIDVESILKETGQKLAEFGEMGGVELNLQTCKHLGAKLVCKIKHSNSFNKDGKRICGPAFGGHESSVCNKEIGG
jgi:hypothetical protein